jgi:hypothetical protein
VKCVKLDSNIFLFVRRTSGHHPRLLHYYCWCVRCNQAKGRCCTVLQLLLDSALILHVLQDLLLPWRIASSTHSTAGTCQGTRHILLGSSLNHPECIHTHAECHVQIKQPGRIGLCYGGNLTGLDVHYIAYLTIPQG